MTHGFEYRHNLLKAVKALFFAVSCPCGSRQVFKGLGFMPWHNFWQKVFKESVEVSVKLGNGFSGSHLPQLGGFALPAYFQE